jgi:23S rRNA (adenine2503-C2)-methyltransferase
MSKKNILSYSYENLEKELLELEFKKFNAKQIFEWLRKKITRKFDEMKNISLKQREILKENFYIPYLELKGQKTIGNR